MELPGKRKKGRRLLKTELLGKRRGKPKNKVYESTRDAGFVGLTYYDSGQRSFYMTDGPILSPDDLKGKKIRTMQSETAIKMVELLGGSAVPMSSSEVFTSLQSNLIDGAENNEFAFYSSFFYCCKLFFS